MRDGVAVTRAACLEAAGAAAACLAAGSRPGAQARAASNDGRAHARSLVAAFRARLPAVRTVLRRGTGRLSLAGEAGALLAAALGRDAALRELQVIVSEPGRPRKTSSDSGHAASPCSLRSTTPWTSGWARRASGPTRTRRAASRARSGAHQSWPQIEIRLAPCAGDAVLMDACTWHRGGANTSGFRRTLLAASFVAASAADGERVPRLGDFNESNL